MKPVRVLAVARRDIESERKYYNKILHGLGKRFSTSVATALRKISENPEAMQVIASGIRRWPVETFPHGVMYSIEQSEIVVISVFNPLQRPAKWQRRV